jgi:2,3-bisphosphoglycerate-independent phosphoglycerate mutase
LVSGGPVRPDGTESFGERACASGKLGALKGIEILPRISPLLRE